MTRKAYDKTLVHRAKHLRDVKGNAYSAKRRRHSTRSFKVAGLF